jgi:hypothetical protein
MDDLELIKSRLAETPISELHALSKETGVPFGTLFKVKYGTTKNPRWETIKPLAAHYRAEQARAAQ